MIDFLLTFADEATARTDAIMGPYYSAPTDDSPGGWRGDCCIPGVAVYTVPGYQTITDSDTGQTYQQEQRQPFGGWHIVVSLQEPDAALTGHPSCVLYADRDKALAGDPAFLTIVQSGLTQDQLNASRIEPLFAGSNYPFGSAP